MRWLLYPIPILGTIAVLIAAALMHVTRAASNRLELTMRYIVNPKERRAASSFIYGEVFKRLEKRDDITIASETMDLTVQQKEEKQKPAA